MSVKFTTFGGMSMLIERSDGFKILVDPYISDNSQATIDVKDLYDVDLILVSHAAFDHFGDAADILSHSNAMMLCDMTSVKKLKDAGTYDQNRVRSVPYGDVKRFGQTTIHVAKAWHTSSMPYGDDGAFLNGFPLGFVIEVEPGVTYYAPGDTALYEDMKLINELYHPNIMSCGISKIREIGARENDAREASLEVMWIGADIVFPGHYIDEHHQDVVDWLACMKVMNPRVKIIMKKNKTFVYTPSKIEEQQMIM